MRGSIDERNWVPVVGGRVAQETTSIKLQKASLVISTEKKMLSLFLNSCSTNGCETHNSFAIM